MRLTAILLLFAFLQVSARGWGQNVTLTVKDEPLQKVFRELYHQTGYSFFYNDDLLSRIGNVSFSVRDVPIDSVLRICFKGRAVEYVVQDKAIIVKERSAVAAPAAAPPEEIHGRVTDGTGAPLEGANVLVKGTRRGAVTGLNGEFVLKGVGADAVLVISIVGYETKELKMEGNRDIRVVLKQSMSKLDETVVKGYYNTTNRLNTGDVTTVKGEDIAKQPVSDPMLALEGRVPGLYIQQASGAPGAYSTIRIRGQNSIFSGNDPLYIVDGVQFSAGSLTNPNTGGGMVGYPSSNGNNINGQGLSPFNALDPGDIESIEVLKDADATAIYGSRGANGVILVTTKKGKAGDTKVDANVYSGVGQVTRRLPLMNTQQYLMMRREAFQNDGATPNPNSDYDLTFWDTTKYTDWQKVLIGNNANFTNAQLNISGGSTNTRFLAGGGYANQGTVFPGSFSDEKTSGLFSIEHASNDGKFHLQLLGNYVNDDNDLPGTDLTSQITLAPDAPALYNSNGVINWQPLNGTATFVNPIARYTLVRANAKTYNLLSDLTMSYEILPGLHLKGNFGYNQMEMNQAIFQPAAAFPPPIANNNPNNRSSSFSTNQIKSWTVEPQLGYDHKLFNGQVNVLIGSTFQENTKSFAGYGGSGFNNDAQIYNIAAAATTYVQGNIYSLYHYNAVFGRVSYNLEDKYILNLTGRRDGSSRFGPGRQFGNFGAAGVGWIFSKEGFMNNQTILSFGKLRGSYGVTGNDQIGDYQYLSTYTASSLTYQGITLLAPTRLTNPNFGWEQVVKLEGGIDLGFLKDRILLSAIYFNNRDNNQLVAYSLSRITGFTSVQANLPATVQNSGWEINLSTVNVEAKNFNWSSAVNITVPKNELTAFPNIQNSSYKTTYAVGQSLFIHYVFHNTGVNPQTGLYSFDTKNPNGVPSAPVDYIVSKPVTQSWYGGIDNTFSYKGVQLDIFIQFVKQLGNNYFYSLGQDGGIYNFNMPVNMLSRWRQPGDLTGIEKFSQTYGTTYAAYANLQRSDGAISDASFIRIKNLAFSYSLSHAWLKNIHVLEVRVYFQCQNLITISNYKGLDPETMGFNLPPLRMLTGGFKVTL